MSEDQSIQLSAEQEVARKIAETHQQAIALAGQANETAIAAITKARECGQYLIEAKQIVGHGRFMSWLSNSNHGWNISIETARKYMALAKLNPEQLQSAQSLRQAYIAAGIIEDRPGERQRNQRTGETSWIDAFGKVSLVFQDVVDKRPIEQWSEMERDDYLLRARPLVRAYAKLGGTIEEAMTADGYGSEG